jgi:hypothetical protein
MRKVIIPAGATPPGEWLAKAQALSKRLRDAKTKEEREILIDRNQELWREEAIRDWLLGLFHNKCWYSEAQDAVSAIHVDHYRPKGRVTDARKTNYCDGYWWLAFEWTNYRICGQLINVKKSDVFPINEGHRAAFDDPASLKLEAPILIDPTTDDARLISFEKDEDGCRATCMPDIDESEQRRVSATIEILGLNRLDRLNQKRAQVWDRCRAIITDYISAAADPHCLKTIQQAIAVTRLKELISYESELSSVAASCIFKNAPGALKAKVYG